MRNYLFIITGVVCFSTVLGQGVISNKIPKKDRIDLAMSQELLMTMDPKLSYIPKSRLIEAEKHLASFQTNIQNRSSTNLEWEERGPNNVGGRTRAILIDKNDATGKTVFAAGVSGGLWKTSNIDANNPQWNCINDFFGSLSISALAQDPNNPSTMYFATGEGFFETASNPGMGLWKSTDSGASWTHLSSTNNANFNFTQSLVVKDNGNILAGTKTGLRESNDGGLTWTQILGTGNGSLSNNINDVVLNNSGHIYVSIGLYDQDGIYKSVNDGSTWVKLTSGLPVTNYARIELAVAPSNNDVIYALYENATSHECLGIYRSSDSGSSWTVLDNPAAYGMTNFARTQAWYNLSVAVDPSNEDHVFIGGIDLLVSNNGGNSWMQVTQWNGENGLEYMHGDQHVILFDSSDPNRLIVGNDGGISLSTNATNVTPTFSNRNQGYNITQFYAAAMHPTSGVNYFLAGAQDNGTQIFDQAGENTTTEASGGDGARCYIDQDNPSIQISSYVYNNYFVSSDNGNTFNYVQLNNFGLFANASTYDSGNNTLYASSSLGNILRWKNPQTLSPSFQHLIVASMSGKQASFVEMSPSIANRIYIGTTTGEVIYVDGANSGFFKNGTVLMNGVSGYVSGISIDPNDEDHIVITYSNYGIVSIYETLDGGNSWTDIEGDLPDMPVRSVMINPADHNEIFIATELGVWKTTSTNGSNTNWIPQNTGLANVRTDQLIYRSSDQLLLAATHGRGLYTSTSLANIVVPVELVDFTIRLEKDYVALFWDVASEIDMEAYYLEKSFNGKDWDEIGRIAATNTTEAKSMSYKDHDLFVKNENYYYRLRLQDLDGSFTYSDVVSVYVESSKKAFEFSVVPNPFVNMVTLHPSVRSEEIVHLHFCNIEGEVLLTIEGEDIVRSHEINLAGFPAGVYFISYLTRTGERGIQRLLKKSGEEEDED